MPRETTRSFLTQERLGGFQARLVAELVKHGIGTSSAFEVLDLSVIAVETQATPGPYRDDNGNGGE